MENKTNKRQEKATLVLRVLCNSNNLISDEEILNTINRAKTMGCSEKVIETLKDAYNLFRNGYITPNLLGKYVH